MTDRKLLIEQLRHKERMHQNSGSKALANLFASAASEIDSLGEDRDSWRRVSERLESENIDLRSENEALKSEKFKVANKLNTLTVNGRPLRVLESVFWEYCMRQGESV